MQTIIIEDLALMLAHYNKCSLKKKWLYLNEYATTTHPSRLSSKIRRSINAFVERFPLEGIKEELFQHQVEWVPFCAEEFPDGLIHCYDPPLGLFVKGNKQLLQNKGLSVVGARRATDYGNQVVKNLFPELIQQNFTIVSGLAKGIDTIAHSKAIGLGGQTVGVIGTGIDIAYPAENKELQVYMGTHQLVVSEYPLGTYPDKSHFPMRNRIIACLTLGTLVVEAKFRSGSLITANIALNEGKEIFAVPGSVFHDFSKGTNDLIKNGAVCVLEAKDIINTFEFL